MDPSMFIALIAGIGIAAAAGLRAFLPLFAMGIAQRFGIIGLHAKFEWLSSDVALVALGAATLIEVLADKVPVVDHFLDMAATFLRPIAARREQMGKRRRRTEHSRVERPLGHLRGDGREVAGRPVAIVRDRVDLRAELLESFGQAYPSVLRAYDQDVVPVGDLALERGGQPQCVRRFGDRVGCPPEQFQRIGRLRPDHTELAAQPGEPDGARP